MRFIGGLAFGLPFVVATCMLGISPGWLDASELIAASATLGLSHPPGHPSYLLASHLASLLPLGSVAFRIALFSALCFGLVVWLAYRVALHIQAIALGEPSISWKTQLLTCAAVWACAFHFTPMLQAVRPEVYTFHGALFFAVIERLLAAWRMARAEDEQPTGGLWGLPSEAKPLWAVSVAALCFAVALANHHYLTLLMAPGVLLFLWCARRWCPISVRSWGGLLLIVLIGLSTYAYLPVRSSQKPPIHWGNAHTLHGFYWQVTAQAWQKSVRPQTVAQSSSQRAMLLLSIYIEQLGLWLLFALIGWYALARMAPWLGAIIALWGGGVFLGRWLMQVNRLDADLHGYLLGSFFLLGCCLAFLAALLWTRLAEALRSERPRLAAIRSGQGAVALLVLLPFALLPYSLLDSRLVSFSLARCQHQKQLGPLLWSELMESPLPYGTLLLTTYYQNGFLRWYRKVVEGQRVDITLLQRNLLVQPIIAAQEAARQPSLKGLLSHLVKKQPKAFYRALREVAGRQSVCFEWGTDIPAEVARGLYPIGMFFCWSPNRTLPSGKGRADDDNAIWEQQTHFWKEVRRLFEAQARSDKESRDILLWTHYQHARFYKQTRRWLAGLAETRRALRLSPKSKDLQELLLFFKRKLGNPL